ncbi:VanZ family protein [Haloarchaeobius baliensis]|uniref:VanZ family protein n=1 Tax=Haloarchaeobius baliensis TaxID=1670458 RepID=UPI003F881D26
MGTRSPDRRCGVAAAATVLLLLASVVPSPFDRHPEWRWVGPDKLLHLVGHAGYAVALAEAFGANRWSEREAAILAVCVSTLHSLVAGRLQRHVSGRAFEAADVVAGLLGAAVAAWGWYTRDASGAEPVGDEGRSEPLSS